MATFQQLTVSWLLLLLKLLHMLRLQPLSSKVTV
jgi:hypothetical protein